ncbi:LysR family transcriptional regulator (plasmid) [Agrobacterium vaccinii]|jgi:DNA-binding transcriptional LysR family regulator|uniref:LysR substrate-binding domain-containing protein n=1 Tax=Agrobacterium TaxID=357 RepID=UPI000DD095B3|nr:MULTISPECIES: LysR substrate-binding domain-containing protein [Agrobacterium]UHS64421.1 LysR family transcriptional regulator [Agrobacterium vaccinii]
MKQRGRQRTTNFELRHLRYFIAVVEERNFERAAARLGIAQPGLSQQIIGLESIVGLPLLDRSRRSVNLTPTGQALYEDAVKIVAQADATLAQLKRVGRGETGRITISYVASAAYSGVLTESLSSFRRGLPDVELQLVEMEMRQQLQRIKDGEVDFGYIRPPAPIPSELNSTVVLREPLVVALASGHNLAAKKAVHLSDLRSDTFITPRQPVDIGFHANTLDACGEAGFKPKINANGRDFTTIASMVAVGIGIALVPESLQCLCLPGIRYLQLIDNDVMTDLAVVYRKTESKPAVRAFIAHHRG